MHKNNSDSIDAASLILASRFLILQQAFLPILRPLLHFCLALSGFGQCFEFFRVNDFDGRATACVFGAFSGVMLFLALVYIDARAGIQRRVGAAGEVEEVGHEVIIEDFYLLFLVLNLRL